MSLRPRSLAAWIVFGALLYGAPVFALDPERPLPLYAVDVWRDGLPQYTVQAVTQTQDGYLWFGTFEGLVRFNGLQFDVFDPQNSPALQVGRIRALFEDRSGMLWIGTIGGGVVRYQEGAFSRFALAIGDSIHAIRQAPDGSMWFATNLGVSRFADGRLTQYAVRNGVQTLSLSADGTLWAGGETGLLRFNGTGFVPVAIEGEHPQVASTLVTRQGTLWVGTVSKGVFRFNPDGVGEPLRAQLPFAWITSIIEDSRGTIWLAGAPGGIARFHNGRFDLLDKNGGLPNTSARALHEDRESNLWVGTNNGLARLSDRKFMTYTVRHGLSDDHMRVVAERRAGGLWVGTYGGGLNLVEDGNVTVYGPDEGFDPFIRCLAEADDGTLWVGSSAGLAKLRDGKATFFTTRDGLAQNRVDALHVLRDGALLISTGVLQIFRNGRFQPYIVDDVRLRDVRVIVEDRRGSIWLGTAAGVFETRDGKVLRGWTTRNGLPSNTVFALLEDGSDLWIGTHEGLARLRQGTIRAVTTREGLPWNVVFQIIDDRRGHFWLTSNRGLARVSRASLEAMLEGRGKHLQVMTFGKSDGMGSDQCNGATQPAGVRLTNGHLAIPTAGGLSIIDPGDLHLNRVPPTVVLRDVIVDGKSLNVRSSYDLSWSASRFEFRFDGNSLLAPELVRFRYRMDGLDRQWIDAGARRVALYNSLPPGEHTLRVMAINNDGVPSAGEARFHFTIATPPWRRWWALLLYALAAIGAVTLLIRVRERTARVKRDELETRIRERTIELEHAEARAHEANRAKSVFLANMSHELRSPLNAVIGFAQLLSRSRTLSSADREKLSVIRRGGEHLLELINDVLSISRIEAGKVILNPRPFDPIGAIDAVVDLVRVRSRASGLDLVVDVDRSFPRTVQGDEGKIRQILMNLLGNAVKFTTVGAVTLRAHWNDGRASFVITDTGAGMTEAEVATLFQPFVQTESGRQSMEGSGLGLMITRELVRLMGGEITVTSQPGAGSTFRFSIDLPRSEEARPADARRRVLHVTPPLPRRRIAVVEDMPENRAVLRSLLESVGFDVREAKNGREGIELWRTWKPELIFMDERMPDLYGSAATRMIREEEGGRRETVIVAVTASVFEEERDKLLEAGADELIMKPWSEEKIFDAIARRLGVMFEEESELKNRVLLVDDNEISRLVARESLMNLGYQVTEAASGAEALDALDRSEFDAVLLDLEMPDLDGRATAREIRKRERLRDLVIIALTAHDREDVSLEEMNDYLPKPIDERQLALVMSRHSLSAHPRTQDAREQIAADSPS